MRKAFWLCVLACLEGCPAEQSGDPGPAEKPVKVPGSFRLPRAAPAPAPLPHVSVTVQPDGALFLNGSAVGFDAELLEALRGELTRDGGDSGGGVVIHASAEVPHARLLQILDVLQRGGVKRVSLARRPLASDGG